MNDAGLNACVLGCLRVCCSFPRGEREALRTWEYQPDKVLQSLVRGTNVRLLLTYEYPLALSPAHQDEFVTVAIGASQVVCGVVTMARSLQAAHAC